MATNNRIVALGLLTAWEVILFGHILKMAFPAGDDDIFTELLAALDRLEQGPAAKG